MKLKFENLAFMLVLCTWILESVSVLMIVFVLCLFLSLSQFNLPPFSFLSLSLFLFIVSSLYLLCHLLFSFLSIFFGEVDRILDWKSGNLCSNVRAIRS